MTEVAEINPYFRTMVSGQHHQRACARSPLRRHGAGAAKVENRCPVSGY